MDEGGAHGISTPQGEGIQLHQSPRLEEQDGFRVDVEVDKIVRLVRHVRPCKKSSENYLATWIAQKK
jgi:hypothetical protein